MSSLSPIVRKFNNPEEWHEARQYYLGASEIACLFGYGYQTFYQKWHEKAGILPPEDLDDILTVVVGDEMESGFANVIRRTREYDMRKVHRYLIHPNEALRLAASLDYELLTSDAGWVPAELKIMDWFSFAQNFEETERSGEYDPPLKFALQLQQQLLITGKPYGYLFVLVSNKQLVEIQMEADEDVHKIIEKHALEFWDSISRQVAPSPDYDKDLQAMYHTLTNVDDGRELDWQNNEWANAQVLAYKEASERERAAKEIKDRIRAEVLDAIGPAIRARCATGNITAKVTDRWGRDRRDLRITPKRNQA